LSGSQIIDRQIVCDAIDALTPQCDEDFPPLATVKLHWLAQAYRKPFSDTRFPAVYFLAVPFPLCGRGELLAYNGLQSTELC
jgi:hypothetical protein